MVPNIPQLIEKIRGTRFEGQDWAPSLALAITLGLGVMVYYGISGDHAGSLAAGLFLSGACLFLGVLLGFLFGIPRSLQSEGPVAVDAKAQKSTSTDGETREDKSAVRVEYRANTNLEQISDWLTKILVGVGLTQLSSVTELFDRAGKYFGPSLGAEDKGPKIAIVVILFFSVCGFLFGYLWTRLFLGGELAKADLASLNQSVREIKQAQEEQSQFDARALSLVNQYLMAPDKSKINVDELKQAVQKASPPVKVQIFYQAREVRRNVAQRPLIERTIPIFEALAASDPEKLYHKNYGQLGYALKEKRNPDYAAAEAALTAAIESRGSARENGYYIYEFNRAICRIKQDADYAQGRASSPEKQKLIRDDLKVALEGDPDLADEDVANWQQINP